MVRPLKLVLRGPAKILLRGLGRLVRGLCKPCLCLIRAECSKIAVDSNAGASVPCLCLRDPVRLTNYLTQQKSSLRIR